MSKILVYGFYKQDANSPGNLGDQLFIEAFSKIFPDYNFTFTDHLSLELIRDKEIIFFGGGSFLNASIDFGNASFGHSREILQALQSKKIFYIGVGAETEISNDHQTLIKQAKFIATRSANHDRLIKLNANVWHCPDLVYALSDQIKYSEKKSKSILIFPNAYLIPKWDAPTWQHLSWEWFKLEFAQVLDELLGQKYHIDFFPMCQTKYIIDDYPAIEIMGKMKKVGSKILNRSTISFVELANLCSNYEMIISQRYHGLILAEMANVPCLNIWHHDKLKFFSGHHIRNLPYYGSSKDALLNEFDNLQFIHNIHPEPIAINTDIFKELRRRVGALI